MNILEDLPGIVSWRISRYRKRLARTLARLDRRDLWKGLTRLSPTNSSVVLVHSSLSALGHIEAGAPTVIDALLEWVSGRALAMPTFTYCYPDNTGNAPIFDRGTTKSVVGAITDHFWRQPHVVRSLHPTHSLACTGPGSPELCAGHELAETPCGDGTPFRRLIAQDCSVLMFGATMASYTLFHAAEDAAEVPYLYEPRPYNLAIRQQDGTIRSVMMRRQDSSVPRRFEAMDRWLEAHRLLMRVRLGYGELLFIPHAAEAHERLVTELRRDQLFLVAKQARQKVARRLGL